MTTVDEIRARWEAVQKPVVQGLKMPPMAAMEAFSDNADDDIAFLLAELDRLRAIEDAARVFLSDDVCQALSDRQMEWAEDQGDIDRLNALKAALTAYDAAKGDTAT
jgi:hypothetical protein